MLAVVVHRSSRGLEALIEKLYGRVVRRCAPWRRIAKGDVQTYDLGTVNTTTLFPAVNSSVLGQMQVYY